MKTIALKFSTLFLAVGLIFGATSCEKDDDNNTPSQPQQKTIAQIAADNGNFDILIDALTRTLYVIVGE